MEEFIVKERETRDSIINILNNSRLPAVTLKAILKEAIEVVFIKEQQEFLLAQAVMIEKEEKEEKKQNEKRRNNNSRLKS